MSTAGRRCSPRSSASRPSLVLVRNAFVGVNFVDLQHRRGHPYPVTLPLVPGTEAAGTVVRWVRVATPTSSANRLFTSDI
jgi:NADPH:quinone reductase-like Zn-dependent oxidoreductase